MPRILTMRNGIIVPVKNPHMCQDCPECVVIFDDSGIHGHLPDKNSETCNKCARLVEAD